MKRLAPMLLVVLVAASCSDDDGGLPDQVRLLTHDSFAISEHLLDSFESETGMSVEVIRASDAGSMVNQAALTSGNPVADVMFGVDTTFLSRALDNDLFVPFSAARINDIRPDLLTSDGFVTPIDFGDVCLNYDISAFASAAAPTSLADLTTPAFAKTLVVENPATSSPGLAFLLATIATFGEDGSYTWQDFWADLRVNDVRVTAGWEEAYYGAFTVGGGGDRPIVVSYASSPPAEVIFADPPVDAAPTAVVTDGCFRQVEYAGILRGTPHPEAAMLLIDFMLTDAFQADVPTSMFVFPAVAGIELPPEFTAHTAVPDAPAFLDPDEIELRREEWIEEWTSIVLR